MGIVDLALDGFQGCYQIGNVVFLNTQDQAVMNRPDRGVAIVSAYDFDTTYDYFI